MPEAVIAPGDKSNTIWNEVGLTNYQEINLMWQVQLAG